MFNILIVLFFFIADVVAQAQTAQEQYDLGMKQFDRGYYTKAIEQFNLVRNYYRDDPLAQMAEVAIADVYFKRGEWDLARYSYDRFRTRYPLHEKASYATFQMGMTLYKKAPNWASRDQKWTSQAIQAWDGFEKQYPNSEYVGEVQEKRQECLERLAKKEWIIADFYAKNKEWEAVRRRSMGLLNMYPSSIYVTETKILLVKSLAEMEQWEAAQKEWQQLQILDNASAEKLLKRYPSLSK